MTTIILDSIPLASFEVKPLIVDRGAVEMARLIDRLYGIAVRWVYGLGNTGFAADLFKELEAALYASNQPHEQVNNLMTYCKAHHISTHMAQPAPLATDYHPFCTLCNDTGRITIEVVIEDLPNGTEQYHELHDDCPLCVPIPVNLKDLPKLITGVTL